jgi:putative membrane protein
MHVSDAKISYMIRYILVRWIANLLGLWLASRLISGIEYGNSLFVLVIAALVFSLVNMLIRPFIVLLSLPAIIFTLGLFTLVINAFMLYLVTLVYPNFTVSSFGIALLAVIIVWVVNYVLNVLFRKD